MEVSRKSWDRSRNEVSSDIGSESNHGKASILQFLQAHRFLFGGIHLAPKLQVVNDWFSFTNVGLALFLATDLEVLNYSAEEEKLGPPLSVGLQNGINRISGGNIIALEGSKDLGPEPTNIGKHGGASVGEFSLASPVSRNPVGETHGIKLSPNS